MEESVLTDQPSTSTSPVVNPPSYFILILSIVLFLSIACSSFLIYRNFQLQKQITEFQTIISPTPSPIINPTTIDSIDPNPDNIIEKDKEVLGIQIDRCCSCPTKINQSTIGTDGWVLYEQGRDYYELLPAQCRDDRAGVCAPCPPLE